MIWETIYFSIPSSNGKWVNFRTWEIIAIQKTEWWEKPTYVFITKDWIDSQYETFLFSSKEVAEKYVFEHIKLQRDYRNSSEIYKKF